MTTHDTRGGRSHSRAGFTLMELMVALTIGGIAITSIYAIGSATTRNFAQQQQLAGTQSSLRVAMDRVKRDIARAGYLSTPNITVSDAAGNLLEACGPENGGIDNLGADGKLAGISQVTNNVPLNVDPKAVALDPTGANANNGFSRDEIRLMANYETSDQYPGIRLVENQTNQVLVPQEWHAYRRDFTRWYENNTNQTDADALREAFTVGRMVRILTSRRKKHFALITKVTAPGETPQGVADPAIIEFTPAVPADCVSEVDQGWIAPVSVIRYAVEDSPAGDGGGFANTGPMAQLIRQETDPRNKGVPLANNDANTRAILDFVVSFNLRFQITQAQPEGQPDNYTLGGLADPTDQAAVNADFATVNQNPHLVRAVEIVLAARTPLTDARFQNPWDAANCANMRCFQVFPEAENQGASRVRRARAQVFVPNIAYEGY